MMMLGDHLGAAPKIVKIRGKCYLIGGGGARQVACPAPKPKPKPGPKPIPKPIPKPKPPVIVHQTAPPSVVRAAASRILAAGKIPAFKPGGARAALLDAREMAPRGTPPIMQRPPVIQSACPPCPPCSPGLPPLITTPAPDYGSGPPFMPDSPPIFNPIFKPAPTTKPPIPTPGDLPPGNIDLIPEDFVDCDDDPDDPECGIPEGFGDGIGDSSWLAFADPKSYVGKATDYVAKKFAEGKAAAAAKLRELRGWVARYKSSRVTLANQINLAKVARDKLAKKGRRTESQKFSGFVVRAEALRSQQSGIDKRLADVSARVKQLNAQGAGLQDGLGIAPVIAVAGLFAIALVIVGVVAVVVKYTKDVTIQGRELDAMISGALKPTEYVEIRNEAERQDPGVGGAVRQTLQPLVWIAGLGVAGWLFMNWQKGRSARA